MATAVGVPTCHRLHLLLHLPTPPPPPYSSFSLFLKPLVTSTTTVTTTTTIAFMHLHIPRRTLISHSLPSFLLVPPSLLLPLSHRSPLSSSPNASLQKEAQTQQFEIPEDNNSGEEIEIKIENSDNKEDGQVKTYGTCPGELEDVVTQLEESTGSVVVGPIGRTVILYRPSITKLKAEEKRQQTRKIFT